MWQTMDCVLVAWRNESNDTNKLAIYSAGFYERFKILFPPSLRPGVRTMSMKPLF